MEVLPEENTICDDIKFRTADKTGDKYRVPIRMADEQGFTYNDAHDAFTLLAPQDGDVVYAELEGAEILGRAQISYGNMSKLSETNSETKSAYKQAVGDTIASLMSTAERRRELSIMYGPGSTGVADLGVVKTVVSGTGTALVVDLTRATWSGGLWPLFKNASFDLYKGATKYTNNAPLVLTGVNQQTCRLTFSGNATDVAAIFAGAPPAGQDAVLTFRGSRTESCIGIQAILENVAQLFGVNAATYPQWKAVTFPVGGALTFDKVAEGLAAAQENGCDNGGKLYLGARAWTDLMTDEAALRRHLGDKAADKVKTGYGRGSLEFDTVAGPVELVVHKFMKQGQAWFITPEHADRIGSRDVSFKLPGDPNEWFFSESATTAASEIRCYGDQAILITRPNLCVNFTSISSTGDAVPA